MDGKVVKTLIVILLVPMVKILAEEKRNYHILFTHTSATHNSSEFVKDTNCLLRPENNNETQKVLDCVLIFAETIKSFNVKAAVQCHPKNTRPWTIIRYQTNGCEFLQILHRTKILRIFADTLRRYMNVDKFKCPFKKDFNYTLTGFKYNPSDFPSYVPEAKYRGILHIIIRDQTVLTITLNGEVKYYKN